MTNQNQRALLEQRYGLPFPDSFFAFWDFARVHSSLLEVLRNRKGMALAHTDLTGPFDFLKEPGLVKDGTPGDARYYNDPPEFLTVAYGRTDGRHWGYYVDDPDAPAFPVVAYYSHDAFELEIVGDTLFEATRDELERLYRGCLEMIEDDPGEQETYERDLGQLARLRQALQTYATGDRPEVGREYIAKYRAILRGARHAIAPTRDGMGIVIPADKYQPLKGADSFHIWNYPPTPEDVRERADEALRLLAQGYPGAALKLGKDLWMYRDFRETSCALLDAAYAALGREWLRARLREAIAYRQECDAQQPQERQGHSVLTLTL